ncbi:hypothetical protein BT63DRAFT_454183 [Microthyrium microscopicum]|uniref:Uncharacterized protein n=1 Tax=Microthyrium microscopicum TaxID=703497 RepID=A0A6A6UEY5_9PEZI|nr:hypothetical protein BT63DRAFT_454183 [Microthyrium microscopicum]
MQFKALLITALAAIVAAAPTNTLNNPLSIALTKIPAEKQHQVMLGLLPQVEKLLASRPELSRQLAKEYPQFSDAQGLISVKAIRDSPVEDLTYYLSTAYSLFSTLFSSIYGGVSGILSWEYSLLGSIGSYLLSFIPGWSTTPAV